MGELYVVRGAKVKCSLGSKTTKLNLPESHGLYVNEKPVLIDTDIVASVNVMPFGECKKKMVDAIQHWQIAGKIPKKMRSLKGDQL